MNGNGNTNTFNEGNVQPLLQLCQQLLKILFIFTALSSAQRRLSNTLLNFKFECIGNQQTDDEIIIAGYAQYFLFTLVKIFIIFYNIIWKCIR